MFCLHCILILLSVYCAQKRALRMSEDSDEFVLVNGERSSVSTASTQSSRQDSVESEHNGASVEEPIVNTEAPEFYNKALPDAILPEGPVPAQAHMDWTIRPEQQQFYSEEARKVAVNNLIIFSIAMFSVPFAVMYICFYYVFNNHETKDDMLYSGIAAMASVYVIIILFIIVAYREEQEAEVSISSDKKRD